MFTTPPTYASWLNQVERWFGILSQREIRRSSFTSAKQLVARIDAFVANHNDRARPFHLDRDRRRDPRQSRPDL